MNTFCSRLILIDTMIWSKKNCGFNLQQTPADDPMINGRIIYSRDCNEGFYLLLIRAHPYSISLIRVAVSTTLYARRIRHIVHLIESRASFFFGYFHPMHACEGKTHKLQVTRINYR